MENWTKCVFLVGIFTFVSLAGKSLADDSEGEVPLIEPEVKPREIKEDLIDVEDFEIGIFTGILSVEDFGSNLVYGARLSYHLSEDLFIQANVGITETEETSFERLSGDVQLLEDDDRNLIYYNLSLGYKFLPGEVFIGSNYAFNTNFYFVAGMGSTEFGGDSRLTANIGWGYQILLADWSSIHFSVRDHIFDTDILGEDKTTHNLEITTGIYLFF